jgi:hypothetical protein
MGTVPLQIFYGTTFAIITWYGGVLALVPSYTADLFGPKYAGVIYGRLMTGWSVTAIGTPSLLASLRGGSAQKAIEDLASKVPPDVFEQHFHAPTSELSSLVATKTVTIARLMEVAPVGTVDPSPFLYDSTFYTMGGVLAVAAVSNALIRKVDPKVFEQEEPEEPKSESEPLKDDKTSETSPSNPDK